MARERLGEGRQSRLDQYWSEDSQGNLVPPQLQSDYLDWLLSDERMPPTKREWCLLQNVPEGTVSKWESDRRFKAEWERRAQERTISPERLQAVIDVLYKNATDMQDVGAAKQFLLYAEKLMPPKEIRRDNSVAHLTDAELCAEVETILVRFRAA